MKTLLGVIGGVFRTAFKLLGAIFSSLSVCALSGGTVGSLSGFLYTVFRLDNPTISLSPQDLVLAGLILGFTAFLLILYLVGMLLQYGVRSILWPALANSLVTAIVTVFVAHWLSFLALAGLVGLLIGILIGSLLCWLCRVMKWRAYAKA